MGLTNTMKIRLGDRHCENILLSEASGAVIHVDFSCMFEKVLQRPWSTHGLIDREKLLRSLNVFPFV